MGHFGQDVAELALVIGLGEERDAFGHVGRLRLDLAGADDDEDIKPVDFSDSKNKTEAAAKKTGPKPQAILDYEKKNKKKKIKVRDGSTGY